MESRTVALYSPVANTFTSCLYYSVMDTYVRSKNVFFTVFENHTKSLIVLNFKPKSPSLMGHPSILYPSLIGHQYIFTPTLIGHQSILPFINWTFQKYLPLKNWT